MAVAFPSVPQSRWFSVHIVCIDDNVGGDIEWMNELWLTGLMTSRTRGLRIYSRTQVGTAMRVEGRNESKGCGISLVAFRAVSTKGVPCRVEIEVLETVGRGLFQAIPVPFPSPSPVFPQAHPFNQGSRDILITKYP